MASGFRSLGVYIATLGIHGRCRVFYGRCLRGDLRRLVMTEDEIRRAAEQLACGAQQARCPNCGVSLGRDHANWCPYPEQMNAAMRNMTWEERAPLYGLALQNMQSKLLSYPSSIPEQSEQCRHCGALLVGGGRICWVYGCGTSQEGRSLECRWRAFLRRWFG